MAKDKQFKKISDFSGKVMYHGSPSESFRELTKSTMNTGDSNLLFGEGLYLTDDPGVAIGYSRQKKNIIKMIAEGKGESFNKSQVLAGKIKQNVRLLDLNKKLPSDAFDSFEKGFVEIGVSKQYVKKMRDMPASELWQEFLEIANDPAEVEEIDYALTGVRNRLEQKGYDGFTHTGGVRGGKKHNVAILWDTGELPPSQKAKGVFRQKGLKDKITPLGRGKTTIGNVINGQPVPRKLKVSNIKQFKTMKEASIIESIMSADKKQVIKKIKNSNLSKREVSYFTDLFNKVSSMKSSRKALKALGKGALKALPVLGAMLPFTESIEAGVRENIPFLGAVENVGVGQVGSEEENLRRSIEEPSSPEFEERTGEQFGDDIGFDEAQRRAIEEPESEQFLQRTDRPLTNEESENDMGMRGELPTPRPEAVQPLNQEAGLTQDEISLLGQLDQSPTQTANAQATVQEGVEPDAPLKEPAAMPDDFNRMPAATPTDEELMAMIDEDQPASNASKAIDSHLQKVGFWEELGARMKTSLGRNTKERLSILKAKYPDKKVTSSGGEILIDGKKIDLPTGQGGYRELTMDIADWTGDITEGVLSAAIEMGIVVAGTASKQGALGAVPSYIAGAMAGSKVGVEARGEAVEFFGGEKMEAEKEAELIRTTTGLNIAFMGAGALFRKSAGAIKNSVKEAFKNTAGKRIERLAVIQKTINDVAESVGTKVEPEALKANIHGIIDTAYNKLEKSIGVLEDETIEAAGNKLFVPENYFKESADIFKDYGVSIDPRTLKASMPTKKVYPFGAEGGKEVLQKIVDEHNDLLTNFVINNGQVTGGLSAKQIFDRTKYLGDIAYARFGDKKTKIGSVYKKLTRASASDRNTVMNDMLKGSEFEGHITEAYEKFSKEINTAKDFKKLFRSDVDSEKMVEALIKPQNSEQILKLKGILGEESKEWAQFSANWMKGLIDKNTSQTTGIFNAEAFLNKVKSLGPKTRQTIMPDESFNKLRTQAIKYAKINTADLTKDTQAQGALESMAKIIVAPTLGIAQLPGTRAKAMWSLAKPNATAADYLLDEGFLKLAKEAATRSEKTAWMRTREVFGKIVANSHKTTLKNGRTIYVSTPLVRNILLQTMPDGTIQAISDVNKGIYNATKEVYNSVTGTSEEEMETKFPTDEELMEEFGL